MNSEEQLKELDQPFSVGEWLIDPPANEMHRAEETLRLEPKVMRVLCVLAGQPGSVISREALESRVWAGMVVSYDALSNTIIKLRKAFGDSSREPRYIETISKSGYRLIAPVEAVTSQVSDQGAEPMGRRITDSRHLSPGWLALVALVLGAVALWWSATGTNDVSTAPSGLSAPRPAIAVLPFANLSEDPEQEYFSDGITEDLITDLSKLSGLLVVARESAFAYKGDLQDEVAIGEALRVDYLLKGSVRRSGEHIRMNVRLLNSDNGNTLWAERYDREIGDIFALQDELTAQIVSALEIALSPDDRKRLTRNYVANVQAYDEFLKGLDHFSRRSFDDNEQAKAHYRNAIELDPGYARAYAALSLAYSRDALDGWDPTARESLEQAGRYADEAERLDPSLPQIYFVKGQLELVRRNYDEAIRNTEHAIAIKPNYADGYALLAWILHFAGRSDEGLASIERAARLNPRIPSVYRMVRGSLHYSRTEADLALADLIPAVEINPRFQQARIWLAAAYASAGRIDDAKWEGSEILTLYPGFSVSAPERAFPIRDPAYLHRFLTDLQKAGLR